MADSINQVYIGKEPEIKKAMAANDILPSIQLQQFFASTEYSAILKKAQSATYKKIVKIMHYSYEETKVEVPKELSLFVKKIIGKEPSAATFLRLGHKDHTLLHDAETEKPGYDIILDLTESWDPEWGGSVIYVDGTGEYNVIPSAANTLSIIQRKKGTHRFIQYINHHAGKNKRLLLKIIV